MANECDFVYKAVNKQIYEIATNSEGCAVINRCIDHGDHGQMRELVEALRPYVTELVKYPHTGYYVVKEVVSNCGFEDCTTVVIRELCDQAAELLSTKNGCELLCAMLTCKQNDKAETMSMIVSDLVNHKREVLELLRNPDSNKALQQLFKVCKEFRPNPTEPLVAVLRESPQFNRQHATDVVARLSAILNSGQDPQAKSAQQARGTQTPRRAK